MKIRAPKKVQFLALASGILLLQGCGGNDSSTTSASISSSNPLSVSQFSPPGGIVDSVPSAVVIAFSETSLDQSQDQGSVLNAMNYQVQCASGIVSNAVGVSFNSVAGTATVYLPQLANGAGDSCQLIVASSISDVAGNALGSTPTATFQIASYGNNGFYVESFSPGSSTVTTMPINVQIQFNESSLDLSGDANSELTAANYTMTCPNGSFNPTSVYSNGSGQVTLNMPYYTPAPNSNCVLSVASNLVDSSGNLVNIASSVNYTIAGANAWNPQPSVSSTSNIQGANPVAGSFFGQNGGGNLALAGFTVNATYSYVTQLGGLWQNAFDPSASLLSGHVYPNNNGSGFGQQQITCPNGMQLNGVFGTYDSQIDSLGITCQSADLTQNFASAPVGGSGTSSFQINCNSGQFATDYYSSYASGFNYSAIDSIQLGCQ
jgi:hypothetical protein